MPLLSLSYDNSLLLSFFRQRAASIRGIVCVYVCTCVCVCVVSQFFSFSPTTAIRDIVVQGDDLDGLEEVEIL